MVSLLGNVFESIFLPALGPLGPLLYSPLALVWRALRDDPAPCSPGDIRGAAPLSMLLGKYLCRQEYLHDQVMPKYYPMASIHDFSGQGSAGPYIEGDLGKGAKGKGRPTS